MSAQQRERSGGRQGLHASEKDSAATNIDWAKAKEVLGWRTMESAPRDGTLLLLLIAPDDDCENPLDDVAGPSRTIGFNNLDHDGEDVWKLAGWCWSHDRFTEGAGTPCAWQPVPEVPS